MVNLDPEEHKQKVIERLLKMGVSRENLKAYTEPPHFTGIFHGQTSGMCPICKIHVVCFCSWCHCQTVRQVQSLTEEEQAVQLRKLRLAERQRKLNRQEVEEKAVLEVVNNVSE